MHVCMSHAVWKAIAKYHWILFHKAFRNADFGLCLGQNWLAFICSFLIISISNLMSPIKLHRSPVPYLQPRCTWWAPLVEIELPLLPNAQDTNKMGDVIINIPIQILGVSEKTNFLNDHNANNYVTTITHSKHHLGMICAGSAFHDHYETLDWRLLALHIFISGRSQMVPLYGTNYIWAYYPASDHEDEQFMWLR